MHAYTTSTRCACRCVHNRNDMGRPPFPPPDNEPCTHGSSTAIVSVQCGGYTPCNAVRSSMAGVFGTGWRPPAPQRPRWPPITPERPIAFIVFGNEQELAWDSVFKWLWPKTPLNDRRCIDCQQFLKRDPQYKGGYLFRCPPEQTGVYPRTQQSVIDQNGFPELCHNIAQKINNLVIDGEWIKWCGILCAKGNHRSDVTARFVQWVLNGDFFDTGPLFGRRKFNCKLFIINTCETVEAAEDMVTAMLRWIKGPRPLEPEPDALYAFDAVHDPEIYEKLGRARNHHKQAQRMVLSTRPPADAVEYPDKDPDEDGSIVVSDNDNDRPSDTRDVPFVQPRPKVRSSRPVTPPRSSPPMQPRPQVRSSRPTTPPRSSPPTPSPWPKHATVPPADIETGHGTSIEDREYADAVQSEVDRFLADVTDHTDGDARDADGSDGSAIPAVFRSSTEKPTLESVGIRRPSRPRRRRKRAPSQE